MPPTSKFTWLFEVEDDDDICSNMECVFELCGARRGGNPKRAVQLRVAAYSAEMGPIL